MDNENARITLLACSKVDWASCLQFAQSTYFKNPTSGEETQNEFTLFCKLINGLKNTDDSLSYLHLTFGIKCNKKTFMRIVELDEFKIWSDEVDEEFVLIVSGSFESWKKAVIRTCKRESDFRTRVLFNKVFLFFERGCEYAIREWHKISLPDGSFILQRREINA